MIASYLKRLFRMKRYFIVYYKGSGRYGYLGFIENNGGYVDFDYIINMASKGKIVGLNECCEIIITGVNEQNKIDHWNIFDEYKVKRKGANK